MKNQHALQHRFSNLFLPLFLMALTGCISQPPSEVRGEQVSAFVIDSHAVPVIDHTIHTITQNSLEGQAAGGAPNNLLDYHIIYFDLDSYIVKSEYQSVLNRHAGYLSRHPQLQIMIRGSADERGSREYNLALGQKRAEAIQSVLRLLGISDRQMEAVSIGEEQPVCTEPTEFCWAKNRKGELIYVDRQP